jgi:TolB-like protein/Tfp pilus assembly protein PilF
MAIWTSEIKELEKLFESLKGQLPDLEKELERLIKADDENMILLYSRRCLEVIITDLCECELNRPRKTEPLKGIIDKLHKERKVPPNIISSMYGLNELSTYGTHPKDFDPEQVKPVLINLDIIIKWYLKYKATGTDIKAKPTEEIRQEIKSTEAEKKSIQIPKNMSIGLVSGLVLLIMIVVAVLFFTKPLDKSIAVLPFINESPVDSNKYFVNGVMEEVLNNLLKIKEFRVLSRTSTDQYKGSDRPTIPEIAKKLGVNYIVEGSGQKYGNTFRLRVQLIKAKGKENHLWGKSFQKELMKTTDLFSIQSEIAQSIATELKAIITPEEKQLIEKVPTDNLEAYNLYLKGTYFAEMATVEGLQKATEYFKQALQKDPNYALAYLGLANVNGGSTFWGNVPPHEAFPKVIEYTNKALKIDSTLAEAYWLLGNIDTYVNWNWKEAERNYKRALQINPNLSLIHMSYSGLLTITGRYEEAISEAKRAEELDPLSGFAMTGSTFYMAGQNDRAIEELKMNLTINPKYYQTHMYLGFAYLTKEMNKEAVSELEKAVDLSKGNPFVISWLVFSYYIIGENDQADKLFDSLKKRSETEYIPATCFFNIYRVRGEEDLAFEWLKRACTEHDTFLPWFRNGFPEGSKEQALLKEVGLL